MTLVVYGASGHGKVVADAARAAGLTVEGFLDDDDSKRGISFFGTSVLGGRGWLAQRSGVRVAWGIGANELRERLCALIVASGHRSQTIIHPRAIVAH